MMKNLSFIIQIFNDAGVQIPTTAQDREVLNL
jgi:hypothetical protein